MKRRVAKLVLFLLLGAIVNVAVAWGCVFGEPFGQSTRSLPLPVGTDAEFWAESMGAHSIYPLIMVDERVAFGVRRRLMTGADPMSLRVSDVTAQEMRVDFDNSALYDQLYEIRCGWPMLSLVAHRRDLKLMPLTPNGPDLSRRWLSVARPGQVSVTPGISIARWAEGRRLEELLPVWPMWFGFGVNSAVYGTLLLGVCAMPSAVRRWRRAKHGLCAGCGYPVGDNSACTECGKPVNTRTF